MSHPRAFLVVAAVAAIGAQAQAQNLLNNPGFEAPLGFDFSNVLNWNGFFGGPAGTFLEAFNTTGADPHAGAAALVTTVRAGAHPTGFNAFTGHVQTVPGVAVGGLYELSIWARLNPSVNNGAEFRIEWWGGSGKISELNSVVSGLLTADYQQFTISDIAPAGAVEARIVMAVQSFTNNGSPADTSVAWDDASFSRIPTPGALSLLAVVGMGVARRRR